jgi:hypothetical protein
MITSQHEVIRLRKGRLAWHRNNTTPGSPRPSQQPPQQPSKHPGTRHPSVQASKHPSIQHPASSVQTSQLPKARANQDHNGNCAQRPAAATAAPPTAPPRGYGRSSAVYLQAAGGAQLQRWLGSDPTRFLTQGALSHHPYLPRTTHTTQPHSTSPRRYAGMPYHVNSPCNALVSAHSYCFQVAAVARLTGLLAYCHAMSHSQAPRLSIGRPRPLPSPI